MKVIFTKKPNLEFFFLFWGGGGGQGGGGRARVSEFFFTQNPNLK